MIEGRTILAIVPARGGSKGVSRKNIKDLAGKPLIAWTIEEARNSRYIDRLIISSDDEEIINVARDWGCEVPFMRPAELARDDTPGIEPVLHAIQTLCEKYDYVVLLQPTSPMRTAEDIDKCIEKCIKSEAPAVVSVCEAEQHPYWMFILDEKTKMRPIIEPEDKVFRRQDLPCAYSLNGAVYMAETVCLLENGTFLTRDTVAYIMPAERSIDIDNENDFIYCQWLLSKDGLS